MSGHSKWHSIKHQKGAADAKRGAVFTKLANAIAVAAKQNGADPQMNFALRLAIQKAKAANMPAANIDRSIKRGAGLLPGQQIEEIVYEGYGPGGVAIIIEAATDNRNRTGPEVRTAITKHGGRMAESGSVTYQFYQKGVIRFTPTDFDAATLDAIEAGADDVDADAAEIVVYTRANQLTAVQAKLSEHGHQIESSELAYIPKNTVIITDTKISQQLLKIMDLLEELDDVTATHANFDIDESIVGSLS